MAEASIMAYFKLDKQMDIIVDASPMGMMTDEYHHFPEVKIIPSTSAKVTISRLNSIFVQQSLPTTDNGPTFQKRNSGTLPFSQVFVIGKPVNIIYSHVRIYSLSLCTFFFFLQVIVYILSLKTKNKNKSKNKI